MLATSKDALSSHFDVSDASQEVCKMLLLVYFRADDAGIPFQTPCFRLAYIICSLPWIRRRKEHEIHYNNCITFLFALRQQLVADRCRHKQQKAIVASAVSLQHQINELDALYLQVNLSLVEFCS